MWTLTSPVSRNHYPTRRADVTVNELDGEALVYDPATANTHRLNGTALFIWRACDGRQDAQEIARRLTDVYEVSGGAAMEHSTRMITELEKAQLLTAPE